MDAKEESAKTVYGARVRIAQKEVDDAQKEVDDAQKEVDGAMAQWEAVGSQLKAVGSQLKAAGDLVGHYTEKVMSLDPVHHPQVIVGYDDMRATRTQILFYTMIKPTRVKTNLLGY